MMPLSEEMRVRMVELMREYFDFRNTDVKWRSAVFEMGADSLVGQGLPETLYGFYCTQANPDLRHSEEHFYYFCLLWDGADFQLMDLGMAGDRAQAKAELGEVMDRILTEGR